MEEQDYGEENYEEENYGEEKVCCEDEKKPPQLCGVVIDSNERRTGKPGRRLF